MRDNKSTNSKANESSTNRVVRRLAGRYLLVLASVAILIIIDQAIIQPMLVHVNAFAPAINVAGRQRMLSQKLTKAALAQQVAGNDAERIMRGDELEQTLGQWTAEHDALLQGSERLGIQPIHTTELESLWHKLEPSYRAMLAAAGELVQADAKSSSNASSAQAVATIVKNESQFLPLMDQIVMQIEDEAAKAVLRLRTVASAIAGTVVVLLVGLGWFVVRPATRTIRAQVDDLEARVDERTSELSAALESLRQEILERQSTEQKNRRLSAELTHAGRVTTMGHVTAGLAHELNQPLGAIANYTEACDVMLAELPHSAESDQVHEFINQAKRAAMRAGQIVRRMRSFVRPNASVETQVGMNALARDIVELCQYESARIGAELLLDLQADDDVVIADPIQIQQVLETIRIMALVKSG